MGHLFAIPLVRKFVADAEPTVLHYRNWQECRMLNHSIKDIMAANAFGGMMKRLGFTDSTTIMVTTNLFAPRGGDWE